MSKKKNKKKKKKEGEKIPIGNQTKRLMTTASFCVCVCVFRLFRPVQVRSVVFTARFADDEQNHNSQTYTTTTAEAGFGRFWCFFAFFHLGSEEIIVLLPRARGMISSPSPQPTPSHRAEVTKTFFFFWRCENCPPLRTRRGQCGNA